jgi:hypothetical protein
VAPSHPSRFSVDLGTAVWNAMRSLSLGLCSGVAGTPRRTGACVLMWFSHTLFRTITSCTVMLIGDVVILGMILFVLYASGSVLSSCIVADLRSETISSIIIAWGVLLESREELVNQGTSADPHVHGFEEVLTRESKRSGLHLVCLGLLLEIVTYFDASIHMQATSAVVTGSLHGIVWILLVVVCVELCLGCCNLGRIRLKKDTYVGHQN